MMNLRAVGIWPRSTRIGRPKSRRVNREQAVLFTGTSHHDVRRGTSGSRLCGSGFCEGGSSATRGGASGSNATSRLRVGRRLLPLGRARLRVGARPVGVSPATGGGLGCPALGVRTGQRFVRIRRWILAVEETIRRALGPVLFPMTRAVQGVCLQRFGATGALAERMNASCRQTQMGGKIEEAGKNSLLVRKNRLHPILRNRTAR